MICYLIENVSIKVNFTRYSKVEDQSINDTFDNLILNLRVPFTEKLYMLGKVKLRIQINRINRIQIMILILIHAAILYLNLILFVLLVKENY